MAPNSCRAAKCVAAARLHTPQRVSGAARGGAEAPAGADAAPGDVRGRWQRSSAAAWAAASSASSGARRPVSSANGAANAASACRDAVLELRTTPHAKPVAPAAAVTAPTAYTKRGSASRATRAASGGTVQPAAATSCAVQCSATAAWHAHVAAATQAQRASPRGSSANGSPASGTSALAATIPTCSGDCISRAVAPAGLSSPGMAAAAIAAEATSSATAAASGAELACPRNVRHDANNTQADAYANTGACEAACSTCMNPTENKPPRLPTEITAATSASGANASVSAIRLGMAARSAYPCPDTAAASTTSPAAIDAAPNVVHCARASAAAAARKASAAAAASDAAASA